ncbi:hypothetical protein DOY81_002349 [Sarcophaga bullata]|nr:hypothetical protein DOY81_002349 [Sarcophaga bullata]
MPIKTQLDLYVEVDVLTTGATAEVVNAILESLLYQRNQIPFVYKTYRYYVNKWLKQQDGNQSNPNGNEIGVHSFQVQRKRQLATNTKEAISAMTEKRIKSLRFLFGSTTFTAKESYTIHIPTDNIYLNHLHSHHQIPQANLNKTLLSLLTSENLYDVFSRNLNPTNIYLELEILENDNCLLKSNNLTAAHSQIFPKDFSPLPASCKDIHLHLILKNSAATDNKNLKCCKELQVFDDFKTLNLQSNDDKKQDKSTDDSKFNPLHNAIPSWWEAETVVRGFKDQPIKGFNIWS